MPELPLELAEGIEQLLEELSPRDLGAGPGTALWSATATWPTITLARAVEVEPRMLAVGQVLAQGASHPAVRGAGWLRTSVTGAIADEPYDLIVLAYVLGEL